MSGMASKPKGKQGVPESAKLTRIEKTFYELTVADLERKIIRFNQHATHLKADNEEISRKIQEIKEDRNGDIRKLQSQVLHMEAESANMEHQAAEMRETLIIRQLDYNNIFEDLKKKHRSMNLELSGEVKLLRAKLYSIEEFRREAHKLLERLDEKKSSNDEIKEIYRETIAQTEEENAKFNDNLVVFIDKRIKDVASHFLTVGEAQTTKRLVRENVNLQKEIDAVKNSDAKMERELSDMKKRHKQLGCEIQEMEAKKSYLIEEFEAKTEIIKKLTARYERLKESQVERLMYRKQFLTLTDYRTCEVLRRGNWKQRMRKCRDAVDRLRMEIEAFNSIRESIESNIDRINKLISQARSNIEDTIDLLKKPSKSCDMKCKDIDSERRDRNHLLEELMKILSIDLEGEAKEPPAVASTCRDLGWKTDLADLQKSTSATLMEIFKRDTRLSSSSSVFDATGPVTPTGFNFPLPEAPLLPAERTCPLDTLIDMERGTSLVFFTQPSDADAQELEQAKRDFEEFTNSDSISDELNLQGVEQSNQVSIATFSKITEIRPEVHDFPTDQIENYLFDTPYEEFDVEDLKDETDFVIGSEDNYNYEDDDEPIQFFF